MKIIDKFVEVSDQALLFTDKALDSPLAWTIVTIASSALIMSGIATGHLIPALFGACLMGGFSGLKISQVFQKALLGGTLGKPDEEKVKELREILHITVIAKFSPGLQSRVLYMEEFDN